MHSTDTTGSCMTCRPSKHLKMKGKLTAIYIITFCTYLAAVGLLCFLRPSSLPDMDIKTFLGIPIDKMLHFLMFLPYPILSSLVFISKDCSYACSLLIVTVLAITGAGVAYGTEMIQASTGYRSYEINDFYADLTGIVTGSLMALAYLTYLKLKK